MKKITSEELTKKEEYFLLWVWAIWGAILWMIAVAISYNESLQED